MWQAGGCQYLAEGFTHLMGASLLPSPWHPQKKSVHFRPCWKEAPSHTSALERESQLKCVLPLQAL